MVAAVETMAYAGEVPWHGLGTKVPQDLSTDEFIKQAGLDWTVSLRGLATFDEDSTGSHLVDVPDYFATVRDTDSSVLGVVGNRYTPIQIRTDTYTQIQI